MTVTSAFAAFAEDELGRLAPGMKADFVVLGADPLATEASGLAKIEVRETWIDGVRRWPAGQPH